MFEEDLILYWMWGILVVSLQTTHFYPASSFYYLLIKFYFQNTVEHGALCAIFCELYII